MSTTDTYIEGDPNRRSSFRRVAAIGTLTIALAALVAWAIHRPHLPVRARAIGAELGLAVLSSPGGRVEINSGEQGTTRRGKAPAIEPVAFWQDWTGGMGDHRGGGGADASGRLYGIDPNAARGSAARPLAITKQAVR